MGKTDKWGKNKDQETVTLNITKLQNKWLRHEVTQAARKSRGTRRLRTERRICSVPWKTLNRCAYTEPGNVPRALDILTHLIPPTTP